MKIIYLSLLATIVLTTGCNDSDKKNSTTTEGVTSTEQKKNNPEPASNDIDLKQNGNYASLFNSPDCKVTTAEDLATALDIPVTDKQDKYGCRFELQLPNNKTKLFSINQEDMSKAAIIKEIKTFKEDETGMLMHEISESGDTYLGNQHSHGRMMIFNPNYDGVIYISYGSVGESRNFSKEERLEHRDLAKKIANMLLKTHQK